MNYCMISAKTTVTTYDHRNLLAAWRSYGSTGLVGRFVCTKPLTEAQTRKLPAGLRERLGSIG